MLKKITGLSLFLLVCGFGSFGQSSPRYLVLFKDKVNTTYSTSKPLEFLTQRAIDRRSRQGIPITTQDLPVNKTYVDAVKTTGATVIYTSRWFNGAVVSATDAQLTQIKALSSFKAIERNIPLANYNSVLTSGLTRRTTVSKFEAESEAPNAGQMKPQLDMIGVTQLQNEGYFGDGMLIAVLDAGFLNANSVGYLSHLFSENRVLDTYDFISRNTTVYDDHSHGLNALSTIAAYQPGIMVGAAYKASFLLYRSENDFSETPYEEAMWLIAAERADSLGTDVINTSLGYYSFDNSVADYKYSDMNGNTTIISKAARYAARTGMILVNSAGNEGNNSWGYISAPADVDSVLSIAAVNVNGIRASFSSYGPASNGVLKPDLAAVGSGTIVGNASGSATSSSGTSFSSPQIAGLAAILWQKYPLLSAQQVVKILRRSGSLASNPDFLLGYGIPNVTKFDEIYKNEYAVLGNEPLAQSQPYLYENPVLSQNIRIQTQNWFSGAQGNVRIYSVSGQQLSSQTVSTDEQTINIPATGFQPGLYIIRLEAGEKTKVLRFIRQ